jgi:hypothetical protein
VQAELSKPEVKLPFPVHCSDLRVDSQKQRHPSGGVSVSSEMVFELEGVELGADGKARARGRLMASMVRAGWAGAALQPAPAERHLSC